jgi:regulator of protease activity HflC (stomatin/prohibitin superfamily)
VIKINTLNWLLIIGGTLFLFWGINILRPIERGAVEFLGKYRGLIEGGFHWYFPILYRIYRVNITERMVDVEPQTVITKDKLNAIVDAVVYYQIKDVKKSIYNVDNHKQQLVSLARTTLRSVVGKMSLTEANENRDEINAKVEAVLDKETNSYGVEVLRVEIEKIEPPQDVQVAMNKVVKAEQERIAATDLASAVEIKADGDKRGEIKKAEGIKQGAILSAQGQAESIETVAKAQAFEIQTINTALNKYFKDDAQIYKKLETVQSSLENGTKYVIDSNSNIMNVISDVAGVNVMPVPEKNIKKKK